MKKLKDDDMMQYLDGTLDAARLAEVEKYLQTDAEDARLLADMKLAMGALREWDEAEPVRVSDNFWPALRDKLPERPQRSWLRGASAQLGAWLWPAHSPLRLSARVAAIAVFVALAVSFLSPRQAVHNVQATDLTAADKMFIQQSLARHDAYVTSQSLSSALPLRNSDGRDGDGDGEDDEGDDYTPE